MNAITQHLMSIEDLQERLAFLHGGTAFDYARDNPATLEIASRHGLGDEASRLIAESREMEKVIAGSVDRAERAQLERKHEAERPHLPRVWLQDAMIPEQHRGHVKGLIDDGGLVLVYGAPSSGKTFFTLDLVGHVAAAMPWRGRKTSGRPVIYVAAEAGRSIMRRFVPWRDKYIGTRAELMPLAIVTRAVNLRQVGDVGDLMADLRAIAVEVGEPPGVVVFDTLSRSMAGGDENSAEDMTSVIGVADMIRDEFSAATVIVHHQGKDAGKGARGHTSLTAAADTVFMVANRVATVEKLRDGMAGEAFAFDLEIVDLGEDEDGEPRTTCIAVPTAAGAEAPRAPQARILTGVGKTALQSLRECLDEHGERMPGTSSIPLGVRAVKIDRWRAQFELRYGSDGDRKSDTVGKAFRRGREALLAAQAVEMSDPYVWLRR